MSSLCIMGAQLKLPVTDQLIGVLEIVGGHIYVPLMHHGGPINGPQE